VALGLHDKHAIVPGGSRGIGKAIARELARERSIWRSWPGTTRIWGDRARVGGRDEQARPSPCSRCTSTEQVGRGARRSCPQPRQAKDPPVDTARYLNGVQFDFSRSRAPTDNAFIEAFNARIRAEFPNASCSVSLADARERIEGWRIDYNTERPCMSGQQHSQGRRGPVNNADPEGEVIPPGVKIQRPEAHRALERSVCVTPMHASASARYWPRITSARPLDLDVPIRVTTLGYSRALTAKASVESVVTIAQHPIFVRSGVTAVTSPTTDGS
jgi:hypothetical protein